MSRNTTKEEVLAYLQKNCYQYISGQEIADSLFVTRAAVWKSIKALIAQGYEIDAVRNKGYRLNQSSEKLNKHLIMQAASEEASHMEVHLYDEITSTNDYARDYFYRNLQKPECVFIAESQTKGRGRKGNEFYSPAGTGLYISFLLYPDLMPAEAAQLTCMAAVAVRETLSRYTKELVSIKWVNDIFIGDRKIAGILTEAGISLEENRLSHVVLGVGINLIPPSEGFPDGLKNIAGVLWPHGILDLPENMRTDETTLGRIRNQLCADLISCIYRFYKHPNENPYIDAYRAASNLIGRYIKLKTPVHEKKAYAKVLTIEDDCSLRIEYEDGTTDRLISGEISVVPY